MTLLELILLFSIYFFLFHLLHSVIQITSIGEWSSWSNWWPCNENGERVRLRKCLTSSALIPCRGDDREIQICKSIISNGEIIIINQYFI